MERSKISLNNSYWMPWWFRIFHHAFYYGFVVPLVTIWLRLVNGMRVKGRWRRRGLKRAVAVSNHSLIMDPAIVNIALWPRRSAYSIKEQLMQGRPLLNIFLRLLGGFPVPYGRAGELEEAVSDYLDEYGLVHFFPEGHKGWKFKNQQINTFERGAFYFALKFQIPVIPVVIIHRARRIFSWTLDALPRRVTVAYLPAIEPSDYSRTEEGLTAAARRMADDTRLLMQKAIDQYHSRI